MAPIKTVPSNSAAKYRWLSWLTVVAGLALFAFGADFGWKRFVMMYRWPTVQAVSTGSRVDSARVKTAGAKPARIMYKMDATFRYTVNGREYTSTAGSGFDTSEYLVARAWVDAHAGGTVNPIHYNPANPAEISAMEPGVHTLLMSILLVGAGVLLTVIGIAAVRRFQYSQDFS